MIDTMVDRVKVTIFDDTASSACAECSAQCEFPWRPQEMVAITAAELRQRLGEEVEVEFIDLAHPPKADGGPYGEIIAQGRAKPYLLPLVAVNGVLRLSGGLSTQRIIQVIDTVREVEGG